MYKAGQRNSWAPHSAPSTTVGRFVLFKGAKRHTFEQHHYNQLNRVLAVFVELNNRLLATTSLFPRAPPQRVLLQTRNHTLPTSYCYWRCCCFWGRVSLPPTAATPAAAPPAASSTCLVETPRRFSGRGFQLDGFAFSTQLSTLLLFNPFSVHQFMATGTCV